MTKSYTDLRRAIEKKEVPNLIFLLYEEPYLLRQLERLLKAELIQAGAESLDYIELSGQKAENLQVDSLRELSQTPAFVSERKLILVKDSGLFRLGKNNSRGPAFRPEVKDLWLELLSALPDSVTVVFRESKIDRRQKNFWQSLEASGAWIVEVKQVDEATLFQWMTAVLAQADLALSRRAAEDISERCNLEMDSIYMEMQKLSAIAQARGLEAVTEELVNEAARPNLNADIFQLLDQLASGRSAEAFKLKKRLLERREPLQLIQFMLARKLRQLLIAKDIASAPALAKRLKVPPFVARKLIQEAKNFKSEDLEAQYRTLFLSDWQVKQGKLSDDIAFDLALLELGALKKK
ncbi:MAG: DNA polymerase III subunit delta [Eubacteriales bacterium]|nr:DNA polymerase III subunit delta [Eubacteriales bacterium]